MYIPDGFTTVTPYFFVLDAERFVEFLKLAFGGDEIGRSMRDDGKIANAQVRIGSSTLMISEASARYKPMPGSYYLYVEDADASMQAALRNGATLEMEVDDMPYGDRQGGVVDPVGNIWWISQRIEKKAYF
jgi:PhnB protein